VAPQHAARHQRRLERGVHGDRAADEVDRLRERRRVAPPRSKRLFCRRSLFLQPNVQSKI
jgi:hypothetical protein